MPQTTVSEVPVSDLDLFTDEARLNPYPLHAQLRALGPVVYLSRHDVYALSRYEQVRDVLGNWELYSSAEGVFMNPQLNEQLKGVITLFLDPPEHTAVRKALGRPLRAERLRELAPQIDAEAESIVSELVARGTFDAATDLAEHLPMAIVSKLVGLGEHGRENMLRWAAATRRPATCPWPGPGTTSGTTSALIRGRWSASCSPSTRRPTTGGRWARTIRSRGVTSTAGAAASTPRSVMPRGRSPSLRSSVISAAPCSG